MLMTFENAIQNILLSHVIFIKMPALEIFFI